MINAHFSVINDTLDRLQLISFRSSGTFPLKILGKHSKNAEFNCNSINGVSTMYQSSLSPQSRDLRTIKRK